jgi:hypothetical protein
MDLIGLDVGFAATRPTSGVGRLGSMGLKLGHATCRWDDRQRILGPVEAVDVAAIDAPLVSDAQHGPRDVERLFSFGLFQRRCKPGASHVAGTGQELRRAGSATARQLEAFTSSRSLKADFPRIWSDTNIVEAFPNAFLGVCVGGSVYESMPKLGRGKKFDWLFDHWCSDGLFRRLAERLGLHDDRIVEACSQNNHHEERAALVCLLTAAAVANGQYTAVGEKVGGYFFLPPWTFWSDWARNELDCQRYRLPTLDVWIEGVVYTCKDLLPSVTAQTLGPISRKPRSC